MRRSAFALLAGLVCACGREGATTRDGASTLAAGPDPIVVRLPRAGGTARAFKFGALDSSIWRSTQAMPAVDRVLAFDQENGFLAFVDTAGFPGWVDLRLGALRRPAKYTFLSLASADGWSVYGVSSTNAIVRMTPSGDWQQASARGVKRLIPTPDGTVLLVLQEKVGAGMLVRMRPPDDAITVSVAIPIADRAAVTPVGDRVYLGSGSGFLSVPPNDIGKVERFRADDDILAISPTPSGDRVFIANKGSARLERFNRYASDVGGSVQLPGLVTELRMDPLGRFMLARPVRGDSAWVVSVASEELVGTVQTAWRPDLPAIAFDGTVAALRGGDVALVDPKSGVVTRTIASGALDVWFFARWNGFRPRARGIDEPVSFRNSGEGTSIAAAATQTPAAPSTIVTDSAAGTTATAPPPPAPAVAPRQQGWTLSFAAVLSLERAREIAAGIDVRGQRPRVLTGEANGTPIFRVVLGPFDSKDEAERLGKASGHSFWVFEGAP